MKQASKQKSVSFNKLLQKLHISSWFLLVAVIFFKPWVTGSAIALIVLTWLFSSGKSTALHQDRNYYFIVLGYFLVLALGLLYSDTAFMQNFLARLIPIVLLPLPIVFPIVNLKALLPKIKWLLIYVAVIACLVSWGDLIIQLHKDGRELPYMFNWLYSRHYLGRLFHASGIYFVLCLLLACHYAFEKLKTERGLSLAIKGSLVLSLLLNALFILHSASRMGLLLLCLSTLIYALYYSYRMKSFNALVGSGLLIGVLISIALSMPWLRVRLLEYSVRPFTEQNAESRLSRWEAIFPIFLEHPLIGVGMGDARAEILVEYEKNNQIIGLENRYNAHNQYLQALIGSGLIGFLFLIGMLIYPMVYFYRRIPIFELVVILNLWAVLMTESLLMRHHGVVVFTLAIWLAYKASYIKTEDGRPE